MYKFNNAGEGGAPKKQEVVNHVIDYKCRGGYREERPSWVKLRQVRGGREKAARGERNYLRYPNQDTPRRRMDT